MGARRGVLWVGAVLNYSIYPSWCIGMFDFPGPFLALHEYVDEYVAVYVVLIYMASSAPHIHTVMDTRVFT